MCEEKNTPVLKSMKGSFNVRISPDLHQKAATVSSKQGISLNQFVAKAIETSLANISAATKKKAV